MVKVCRQKTFYVCAHLYCCIMIQNSMNIVRCQYFTKYCIVGILLLRSGNAMCFKSIVMFLVAICMRCQVYAVVCHSVLKLVVNFKLTTSCNVLFLYCDKK